MVEHDQASKKNTSIFKTARPVLENREKEEKGECEVRMDGEAQAVEMQDLNAVQRFFANLFGGNKDKSRPSQGQPQDAQRVCGASGKLPDAEAVPVPEAKVASLGDPNSKLPPRPGTPESHAEDFDAACLADFDLMKVLGKGSFGKVFLVTKYDNKAILAMKVLKKSKLKRPKQIERTKTERRVLEVARGNKFTMSLHYAFQTPEKLYVVLDYCQGGELFFHLSRFRKFPEPVACYYTAELVCALGFLHEHGIIYRDMKPENVLLDAQGHVQLGDFGLAKDNIWHPSYGARSICGTPEYMAPEVLDKVGHGSAVDWWGLGMLLYEMLTGLPPWYTKDRQKLFQRLRFAPLHIPVNMSSKCASVVRSLLIRDPNERLGSQHINDIKDHPFFIDSPGFSWEMLERLELPPPINPMEGLNCDVDGSDTSNFDPQFTKMSIDSDDEQANVNADQTYEHFAGFGFSRSVCESHDDDTSSNGTLTTCGSGTDMYSLNEELSRSGLSKE